MGVFLGSSSKTSRTISPKKSESLRWVQGGPPTSYERGYGAPINGLVNW